MVTAPYPTMHLSMLSKGEAGNVITEDWGDVLHPSFENTPLLHINLFLIQK